MTLRTFLFAATWLATTVIAQDAPPAAVAAPAAEAPAADGTIEEIVVNGEYPGPGLWKVTRAAEADGHVLWIIGDPPPLPKRLSWKSRAVEAIVLRSQEILRDTGVTMKPDEKIGFFKSVGLIPSALKARKNPDEAKLSDVLPADVYARWLVQKKRFLGRDGGVENWRPLFAADKLRKAAMSDLGLRDSGMVWDVVGDLAKRNKLRVTSPMLEFTIKASEIKTKIKEFSKESIPDVECLSETLDYTQALSNETVEAARARAWATADIDTLASLPPLPNPGLACVMAIMSSQVAKELLPSDIPDQVQARWIAEAERALRENETTFAIVPLAKLMRDDSYAAKLREKGYVVDAPR
ncbi:MAG TPA: TraB/GumN family protein [Steroidobacteraceae bacterium]|nr:TraB/GumN family protein [Steroidobacteraceae bacterium]